jgi:hypothetical protein
MEAAAHVKEIFSNVEEDTPTDEGKDNETLYLLGL